LWAAALGLSGAMRWLHAAVARRPAPLRRPLSSLPSQIGPYRLEKEFPRLSREAEGALRATAYLTRLYRDTRRGPTDPGGEVRLHLAYFTGTPDTVIHVPEICYTAAGARGRDIEQTELDLGFDSGSGRPAVRTAAGMPVELPVGPVPVRLFEFVPPGGDRPATVLYFFIANGRLLGMPEQVRALVFDLRNRRAYWCKVEIWVRHARERSVVRRAATEFLRVMLPEILACLPRNRDLNAP